MSFFSFIAVLTGTLSALLGVYVFTKGKTRRLRTLFLVTMVFLSWWLFSSAHYYAADSYERFLFWYRVSLPGFFLFYGALFHFILLLYRNNKLSKVFMAGWYGMVALFIGYGIRVADVFTRNYELVDELWRFDHRYNSPNFAAVTLFIYGVFILSCFFLFLWAFRKAGTYKSRRQGRIIIQVFVVITIVSSIETLLIPQVSAYRSLGIFPLMFFFLVIALGYAVVRYQFPGVTLAYVSREIMCNVEELVFLFDHYLQLETINDSALACMETSFERLRKRELKTLFYGGEELSPAIEKLRSSEESSCSCHITLRNFGAHESILVDARVSIVRDKYGDEIGVLVIGKRIKRARDLALDYGLTRRELDVLQGIVNGKSTREISNTLYISERTTKTHLTHIFAKLAVKNRVQLICNVMDYNLIPESSSEKRVLLHLIDEVPPD